MAGFHCAYEVITYCLQCSKKLLMALVKISEMAKNVNHSYGGVSAVNWNLCSCLIETALTVPEGTFFQGDICAIHT